jgi:hypothetical protein
MKNEAHYIQAGYRFEKTKSLDNANNIKAWLNLELQENQEFRSEILRLFEQGRSEGRSS